MWTYAVVTALSYQSFEVLQVVDLLHRSPMFLAKAGDLKMTCQGQKVWFVITDQKGVNAP